MADVKRGETVVSVGTRKGLFLLHSKDRRKWKLRGPFFEGVTVHDAKLDARDGRTVWAGVTSDHWGASVQRSRDWGGKWKRSKTEPRYPKESGLSVDRIWSVEPGIDGETWAGVEPAGLFRSDDGGDTWRSVEGLNAREDRKSWMPGGGGLNLHTILPYPGDAKRMIVGASAVGVLGTSDAGKSWRVMNGDVRADYSPKKRTDEHETGSCAHKIVRDSRDPAVLYMQNHCGVYRRARGDAGWTDISKGLPSRFGFPMVAHPHDRGTVYVAPLAGDFNRVMPDGAMAIWRTKDSGKSWKRLAKGLPQKNAWATVLREGMAVDGEDPAGVYFGTTTGEVWASRDEGASWSLAAERLPPVSSVHAARAG